MNSNKLSVVGDAMASDPPLRSSEWSEQENTLLGEQGDVVTCLSSSEEAPLDTNGGDALDSAHVQLDLSKDRAHAIPFEITQETFPIPSAAPDDADGVGSEWMWRPGRALRIAYITWNMSSNEPVEEQVASYCVQPNAHLVAVCTQENGPFIGAKVYHERWEAFLTAKCLQNQYTMVMSKSLWALHLAVFARTRDVANFVVHPHEGSVATGIMKGMGGNKGGVAIAIALRMTPRKNRVGKQGSPASKGAKKSAGAQAGLPNARFPSPSRGSAMAQPEEHHVAFQLSPFTRSSTAGRVSEEEERTHPAESIQYSPPKSRPTTSHKLLQPSPLQQEQASLGSLGHGQGGRERPGKVKYLTILFIGAHLAAHQQAVKLRNHDYRSIVRRMPVGLSGCYRRFFKAHLADTGALAHCVTQSGLTLEEKQMQKETKIRASLDRGNFVMRGKRRGTSVSGFSPHAIASSSPYSPGCAASSPKGKAVSSIADQRPSAVPTASRAVGVIVAEECHESNETYRPLMAFQTPQPSSAGPRGLMCRSSRAGEEGDVHGGNAEDDDDDGGGAGSSSTTSVSSGGSLATSVARSESSFDDESGNTWRNSSSSLSCSATPSCTSWGEEDFVHRFESSSSTASPMVCEPIPVVGAIEPQRRVSGEAKATLAESLASIGAPKNDLSMTQVPSKVAVWRSNLVVAEKGIEMSDPHAIPTEESATVSSKQLARQMSLYSEVFSKVSKPKSKSRSKKLESTTRKLHRDATDEFDLTLFGGDLNYRINGTRRAIERIVTEHQVLRSVLVVNDQLNLEKEKGNVFRGFQEAQLLFRPTYKYEVADGVTQDVYNLGSKKEKRRMPAYCDRILYKQPTWTAGGNASGGAAHHSHPHPTKSTVESETSPLKLCAPSAPSFATPSSASSVSVRLYTDVPSVRTSDHRPVVALLDVATTHFLRKPFESKPNP